MSETRGILDGVRVIDLTMWFQGPVAAQHLADLGAEVIHFESTKGGDLARGVRSIRALPIGDWNQYFLVINRNKKSMAVDLNKPEGRAIMHKLVENSDVFLTNLSAKALEKWECSYEQLAKKNPRLVYAMGSGYGPFGRITKPSFDLTVQALTGIMSRLGEPGQPPIYLGMGSGDAMGGMMAALGIMLALYARQHTGRGQFLDASLYGAQLFMAAPTLQAYLATGEPRYAKQQPRKAARNALWNRYRAKDKWLVLCAHDDEAGERWRRFATALGTEALASDPRFATHAARREHAHDLVDTLDAAFGKREAGDWVKQLRHAGFACSEVGNLEDLSDDPQAWVNRYFMKTHCDEVDREVTIRGMPVTFEKTPGVVNALGPVLGQDTELLLTETLGYTWDDVGTLKAAGVIL
jgi:crotonobetainyl-CoA:carnitine CoA-transferase CaiB-like acyl-CoA transferase